MTSRPNNRRRVLLGIFVLLGLAVIIDRTGLAGEGSSEGVVQRYALASSQLDRQRDLLASADAVRAEITELRETWDRIRPGLVSASTVELAPAALRERVRRELAGAGIGDVLVLSEEVRGEPGSEPSAGLVPMRIRVSFDAEDSPALYRAIDRIEQSDVLLARIGEMVARGGGLNAVAQRVTVTLSIDTVVLIGEGR